MSFYGGKSHAVTISKRSVTADRDLIHQVPPHLSPYFISILIMLHIGLIPLHKSHLPTRAGHVGVISNSVIFVVIFVQPHKIVLATPLLSISYIVKNAWWEDLPTGPLKNLNFAASKSMFVSLCFVVCCFAQVLVPRNNRLLGS